MKNAERQKANEAKRNEAQPHTKGHAVHEYEHIITIACLIVGYALGRIAERRSNDRMMRTAAERIASEIRSEMGKPSLAHALAYAREPRRCHALAELAANALMAKGIAL